MKQLVVYTNSTDSFKMEFVRAVTSYFGIKQVPIKKFWHHHFVQKVFANLRIIFPINIFKTKSKSIVLVPSNGFLLIHDSLPYCFTHEIVPFLWDCWPGSWNKLESALRLLRVRLCFVTSGQVQVEMSKRIPEIRFVFINEAVNIDLFQHALNLKNRPIKVFEVGRKHPQYHKILASLFAKGDYQLCEYADDYYDTLAKSQVTISFPRCDTFPAMAGHIETLTERYWEAMLSKCLIVGRAPQELVDLLGYNPVINVNWNSPTTQIQEILNCIDKYQILVDKNYIAACEKGTWPSRMSRVKMEICSL